MLNHWPLRACLILSCVGGSAVFASPLPKRPPPDGPLSTEQIVERALTRAQWASRLNRQTNYAYEKTTTTEEVDGKGRVKSRKEKTVEFERGVGTLKELTLNGEPASEREFKKEAQATADRQAKSKSDRRDDNWTQYLTKETIARYTFELIGHEEVAGRDCYVLSFKPVSDKLPVKQITDRLLNRVAGKVWVDCREFEIAKAQIRLRDEVNMWGGLLGSMKQFDYELERARIGEDVWSARCSNLELEGRKLFDSTHMRVRSESGNFRKPLAFK